MTFKRENSQFPDSLLVLLIDGSVRRLAGPDHLSPPHGLLANRILFRIYSWNLFVTCVIQLYRSLFGVSKSTILNETYEVHCFSLRRFSRPRNIAILNFMQFWHFCSVHTISSVMCHGLFVLGQDIPNNAIFCVFLWGLNPQFGNILKIS